CGRERQSGGVAGAGGVVGGAGMTQAIKERPILFSGEMVRAILDGRKTQTRRVVKQMQADPPERAMLIDGDVWVGLSPEQVCPEDYDRTIYGAPIEYPIGDMIPFGKIVVGGGDGHSLRCPYGQPGDQLWVKEGFQ